MPTGYTYGIIDGTTKTFEDFAKQCIRNFGAAIHMRDEPSDKEYEQRTPSDYYRDRLQQAREKLEKANTLTDSELILMRKAELNESKEYNIKRIKETIESRKRLDAFLVKAKAFIPPTSEHRGYAKFMVDQIEDTIGHDGKTDYWDNDLLDIEAQLKNLNAEDIKAELIKDANKDIAYHSKEHKDDLKRCADSNKWVEAALNALK